MNVSSWSACSRSSCVMARDHRGSPLLTLTPRGEEALARVTDRAAKLHRTLFAAMPDEEIRATRASLRRLLADPLDRHEGAAGKR
ncbi:hypothetical protein ACGFOU_16415 [Streptomyces sp. NPDC048595]|uniref:hypothetical protein n=1 Tax=Streptomyces sp. NPDC048595 TaxID=3365576 RepID=UPI0037108D1A